MSAAAKIIPAPRSIFLSKQILQCFHAIHIPGFLIRILNLHIHFLTIHRHFPRCANAKLYLFSFNFKYRDLHIVVNHKRFILFSG